MGEGNFGGDGSVRWRVRARHHKDLANDDPDPGGNNPKKHGGADKDHGSYFVVKLRRPHNTTVNEFWTQLVNGGLSIEGDYGVLKLTIESQEKTPKQIIVSWSKPEEETTAKRTAGSTRQANS